jgi:hypothetical protein
MTVQVHWMAHHGLLCNTMRFFPFFNQILSTSERPYYPYSTNSGSYFPLVQNAVLERERL